MSAEYAVNGREVAAKVQVVDECNLNCVGCDHFAPLAETSHLSVREFSETIVNLRRVTDNHVREVIIYGGEPLLHESLATLLKITATALPDAWLTVETNGILLADWLACNESTATKYGVTFKVTEYAPTAGIVQRLTSSFPTIKFERTVMPSTAEREVNAGGFKASMFNVNLSAPTRDGVVERSRCYCKAYEPFSICVRRGFAYPCPLAMCLDIADQNFGTDWAKRSGGVELKTASFDDLRAVSEEPILLCKNCGNVELGIPWSVSKKSSGEWFSDKVACK